MNTDGKSRKHKANSKAQKIIYEILQKENKIAKQEQLQIQTTQQIITKTR